MSTNRDEEKRFWAVYLVKLIELLLLSTWIIVIVVYKTIVWISDNEKERAINIEELVLKKIIFLNPIFLEKVIQPRIRK